MPPQNTPQQQPPLNQQEQPYQPRDMQQPAPGNQYQPQTINLPPNTNQQRLPQPMAAQHQLMQQNQQNQQMEPMPQRLRPVFGVPLEELLLRDGNAVPMVVIQCMQAVDLYGLDYEGIYRQAGQNTHVQKIKN